MNFEVLEKYRMRTGPFATVDGDRHGLFHIKTKTHIHLKVLSSCMEDEDWVHVSVSLPNRCPTWGEMSLIKDLFFGENALVVQYHPKKENYKNLHPYCLHLWEYRSGTMPTPPIHMV